MCACSLDFTCARCAGTPFDPRYFDTEPDLAMRYAVQSIPNMIVFAHGKPTAQAIGAQPKADLERALGLIA